MPRQPPSKPEKPVVKYIVAYNVEVGYNAAVKPLDGDNWRKTSMVLWVNHGTGEFETRNTLYKRERGI